MAEDDISLTVKLKNTEQARKDLKDLLNDVKRAEAGMRQVGAGGRGGGGVGKPEPSTRQPGGSGPSMGSLTGGMFAANLLSQGFSAFKQTLGTVFDPLATTKEKSSRVIQAGLAAIPFVGDVAAQIYSNMAEEQLAPSRNARQRTLSAFGSSIRAGADLSADSGLGQLMLRRYEFERQREENFRRGERFLAKHTDDKGIDLVAIGKQAEAEARSLLPKETIEEAASYLQKASSALDYASQNIAINTESLGKLLKQYENFFSGRARLGMTR